MINNYNELVDSIQNELSRNDLAEQIPEWVQLAELSLGRYCRLVDGEQTATGTIAASSSTFDLPTGCKVVRHMQTGTAPDLKNWEIVSWPTYNAVLNNDTGTTSRAVAFLGRTAYLAPVQGVATPYTLFYYGKPAPLSEENPTNDLLEMGADVLKYWALLFSAPYLGDDERIQTWNAMVSEGRATLRKEYWNTQAGGGPLRMRNDVVGNDQHSRLL